MKLLQATQSDVGSRLLRDRKRRLQVFLIHQVQGHFQFVGGVGDVFPAEERVDLSRGRTLQIVRPWKCGITIGICEDRIGFVLLDV